MQWTPSVSHPTPPRGEQEGVRRGGGEGEGGEGGSEGEGEGSGQFKIDTACFSVKPHKVHL